MKRPPTGTVSLRRTATGYEATLPPFDKRTPSAQRPPAHVITVVRDDDEYLDLRQTYDYRLGRHVEEIRGRYETLTAFREYVRDLWVRRWVNNLRTHMRDLTRAERREYEAFRSYVLGSPGVEVCPGEVGEIPGFGAYRRHDGCCDSTWNLILPDGVTLGSLYLGWAEETR